MATRLPSERSTSARKGRACIAALRAWAAFASLALSVPAAHAGGFIQINTPSIVLAPTPSDYLNDYVEATGVSGIQVKLKNTGSTGLTLMVRCPDPAPPIALADLMLRTLTPPGPGGLTMSAFTPVSGLNQRVWSSGVQQGPFTTVSVDVRIRNLFGYDDAAIGGTTAYANTLVFTVVEP